ncbi:HEPN domain-containing protein [Priestia megaterium]|uniref:HEPN domain-containing protein n=1 Tax=Priestia megaterium TaxID=1404 RepID=UPI00221F4C0D|nr:HEPN domain-containing protein [Priestia megaterium]MDC7772229.1 HEPN domain-containing protein [Priestia megaterium]UYT83800.1 HEPN domain-containing protein [Priestia megaterium]
MYNLAAKQTLEDCEDELQVIDEFIEKDKFNSKNPYLVKYCVIRVSGAIELAFKTIIADAFDFNANERVKNFAEKEIRDSSKNPSYSNICTLLKKIDNVWNEQFKRNINVEKARDSSLLTSLESLNEARNSFAHGKTTTVSMDGVILYFNKASKIIEILDSIVKNDEQVLINKIEQSAHSIGMIKEILLNEGEQKTLIRVLSKNIYSFSNLDNLNSALCACLEDESLAQDKLLWGDIIKFVTNSLPLLESTQRLNLLIEMNSQKTPQNFKALLFNSLKSLQQLSNDVLKNEEFDILGELLSELLLESIKEPDMLTEYSREHVMVILGIISTYRYNKLLDILESWNQSELDLGKLVIILCDEEDVNKINYKNLKELRIFEKIIELSKQKYHGVELPRIEELDKLKDQIDIKGKVRKAMVHLLVETNSQTAK